MTWKNVKGDPSAYQAMSTDVWPTENVQDGSSLHCIDKGEMYVFHNGTWEVDLRLDTTLKAFI